MAVKRPGSIKMTELSEFNAKGLESLRRLCRSGGEVAVRRADRSVAGAAGQVDWVVGSVHDVVQAGGVRQELTNL